MNDGVIILQQMEIINYVVKLFVEFFKFQDDEIGDGIIGVVVFVGVFFEQVVEFIDKGIYFICIVDGYDQVCDIVVVEFDRIFDVIEFDKENIENLIKVVRISLGSKIVFKVYDQFVKIVVDVVLFVVDLEWKDVDFELIKMDGKVGGFFEDIFFVKGVIVDKDFLYLQMFFEVWDVKIVILMCVFEFFKFKIKYKLEISSVEEFKKL